jgi:hypothetical protein
MLLKMNIIKCFVEVDIEVLELNNIVMYLGLVNIFLIVICQLRARKKICNIANYIKDYFTLRNNTLENIIVS